MRRWYLECMLDGDMRLLEFEELFPIRQPTVLYHLGMLERSGLLLSRKQGPMRLYSLRPEGLDEAHTWLQRLWSRYPAPPVNLSRR